MWGFEMQIGQIVDLPNDYSGYARVRDEYGEEYTVHGSEIPTEAGIGDEMAYHVDISQNESGNVTTLRHTTYGK